MQKKNKEIIENTKVSDLIKLKGYLVKYGGKFEIEDFEKVLKDKKHSNVTSFFKWLLRSYDDDTCMLFYNIYQKIIKDLGIISLYGKSFFMDI